MFTKNNLPTPDNKDALREKLAEDIRQYLKNGGQVTTLARGQSATEKGRIEWERQSKFKDKDYE
tara:strand:- start:385 stop:576 length:192 start_codon:yes stop_codon:yes gene_type:complete